MLHKTVWLLLGYLVYALVNVARILMVVHFVELEGGGGNFHWSHDIMGNTILLVVGLGLFIAFIRIGRPKKY